MKILGTSLLFVLISLILGGCSEKTEDTHVYFVQITDTHIGKDDHKARTSRCIEEINKLPMEISCVIHTGDIFHDAMGDVEKAKEDLKPFEKLKYPIHFLPGNRDIQEQGYDVSLKSYEKVFGNVNTVELYHNVAFILFYSEPLRNRYRHDCMQQFRWIEGMLKKHGDHPIIVFHHAPSVENFDNNEIHGGWPGDIKEKWIRLLNTYDVRAVIAGHFHRDEHHWLGRVPLYISSSIAGFHGRQATFRIYDYYNGKMRYRTRYVR